MTFHKYYQKHHDQTVAVLHVRNNQHHDQFLSRVLSDLSLQKLVDHTIIHSSYSNSLYIFIKCPNTCSGKKA